MNDRAAEELALLRRRWADLVHEPSSGWVMIKEYPLPAGWTTRQVDVAFQIPALLPGQAPYAFYALGHLRYRGQQPWNYSFPIPVGAPTPSQHNA
jgi:hypothetical protein